MLVSSSLVGSAAREGLPPSSAGALPSALPPGFQPAAVRLFGQVQELFEGGVGVFQVPRGTERDRGDGPVFEMDATARGLVFVASTQTGIPDRPAQAPEQALVEVAAAGPFETGDGLVPALEEVRLGEGLPFGFWKGVRHSWVLGNAQRDATSENIKRGALYPHIGGTGPYRCPSDHSTVKDQPEQTRLRSYSLNGELNYWIIADAESGLPILQALHQESQLRRPSATYGFLAVKAETIDSGIFGLPGPAARTEEELRRDLLEPDRNRWLHLPGERHQSGANLSFLDGRVEAHKWDFTPIVAISAQGHRPVNDLDGEDMRWQVQHGAAWQRVFP
ncbi:MAG: hypothetical protein FJ387_08310 [Verrucomicrobia bacterium]|nr:hypothetical protein [Verrucomicrobiota bacterium]